LAVPYLRHAAFLDLANLAGNSADGVHMATAGGLWQALVFGFGGFRSKDGQARLEPHLPPEWDHLRFVVSVRGSRLRVEVTADRLSVSLISGESVDLEILGKLYPVTAQPLEVMR
jgi:alpha,alpha-trehalose phosphorylase